MSRISKEEWRKYIDRLAKINAAAADEMLRWIELNGLENAEKMLTHAFALATKYGEAGAALAAEMYDATAALASAGLPAAVPASTATYAEVAEAVNGAAKYSNPKTVSSAVGRLAKMAEVDTVMNNAIRDGAEWAWIPSGETCAFCLTLASRGWQRASRNALKNGHARHIHANCNCIYAVRFSEDMEISGYDPEEYAEIYHGAAGRNANTKINSIRRKMYTENKESINAQKREAYRLRREREKQEQ